MGSYPPPLRLLSSPTVPPSDRSRPVRTLPPPLLPLAAGLGSVVPVPGPARTGRVLPLRERRPPVSRWHPGPQRRWLGHRRRRRRGGGGGRPRAGRHRLRAIPHPPCHCRVTRCCRPPPPPLHSGPARRVGPPPLRQVPTRHGPHPTQSESTCSGPGSFRLNPPCHPFSTNPRPRTSNPR
jgi:hypothetical protein